MGAYLDIQYAVVGKPQWARRVLSLVSPLAQMPKSIHPMLLSVVRQAEISVTKNLDLEKSFIFLRALESEVAHGYKFLQNRVRYG